MPGLRCFADAWGTASGDGDGADSLKVASNSGDESLRKAEEAAAEAKQAAAEAKRIALEAAEERRKLEEEAAAEATRAAAELHAAALAAAEAKRISERHDTAADKFLGTVDQVDLSQLVGAEIGMRRLTLIEHVEEKRIKEEESILKDR